MNIGRVLQGGLFTSDFLIDAIQEMVEWQKWDEGAVLETELQNIFNAFPIDQNPNESQTEDDLIWPILNCLGWKVHLRQQNLTPQGRDDVPDFYLRTMGTRRVPMVSPRSGDATSGAWQL